MQIMNREEIQRAQDEWREENAPLGKLLGYPQCCIDAFCSDAPQVIKGRKVSKEDRIRYKASFMNGQYTGFIPCLYHAQEILAGKITLMSLIKDRDPDYGIFPWGF